MSESPFTEGPPEVDRRELLKDLQLQRIREQGMDRRGLDTMGLEPPRKPVQSEMKNLAPRVADPLTPVYEALSPAMQAYGLGQGVGEVAVAPTWWEKAKAAFPLVASMVPIPGAPRGKGKPAAPFARELDNLGYYSQALEAAKGWPQAKGTPEQVMAALKKAGVKDAEIAATGLPAFLEGKPQITRDDLVSHLRENRVGLQEGRYGPAQHEIIRSEDGAVMDGPFASESDARSRMRAYRDPSDMFIEESFPPGVKGDSKWADYSLDPSNPTYRETVLHLPEQGKAELDRLLAERAKLSEQITPTNRAIPPGMPELSRRIEELQEQARGFQSGHWSEPNVIAHMRTSLQKDAQGRPVFLLDELQSDWGQKLREGGVRDEAKIADLGARMKAAGDRYNALSDQAASAIIDQDGVRGRDATRSSESIQKWLRDNGRAPEADALAEASRNYNLLDAEHRTATATTPGHPLVNTTDQWTTTAMRRLLQQANEAGAEGIAITPGQLQNERFGLEKHVSELSYNPQGQVLTARLHNGRRGETFENTPPDKLASIVGKEMADKLLAQPLSRDVLGYDGHVLSGTDLKMGGEGMRYAYDQMYPKGLEKMLRKMDPQYPGPDRYGTFLVREDEKMPRHGMPEGYGLYRRGDTTGPEAEITRFPYFPLTPAVKEQIAKGLPLFSAGGIAALVPPKPGEPQQPVSDDNPFDYGL